MFISRLISLVCVIINSIALFIGFLTGSYISMAVAAVFICYCGNRLLLDDNKKPEDMETI